MKQKFGIILLENMQLIIRIYEADNAEWRLLHYHDNDFPFEKDEAKKAIAISQKIADFLTTEPAQHVVEWKTCARQLPQPVVNKISSVTGLPIENLTPLREQELLCKGIFTELW